MQIILQLLLIFFVLEQLSKQLQCILGCICNVFVSSFVAFQFQCNHFVFTSGINQADMGKRAGVSRQTISLIERGDYSPSVTLALKLAKICQVTVEDIFSYTEEENDE